MLRAGYAAVPGFAGPPAGLTASLSLGRSLGIDVSILIPVKNRADLTAACLDALAATLPDSLNTEILVCDDASTDATPELLARWGDRVRVLRRSPGEPGGFARNNNAMARMARGRAWVLLNNDTVPMPGWLEPMLAELDREPAVGVVGNVQLFPGEPGARAINHAGVVFDDERRPVHLYEGMPAALAAARATRELQAVTAACWAVRPELWASLGGLDEGFVNGHEDLDFCFRARAAGARVLVAGDSRIVHHGVSTPGRLDHDRSNTELFFERHRDTIRSDMVSIAARDGVAWPDRSLAYRAARGVWRTPGMRSALGLMMRSKLGLRVRGRMLRRLTKTP